MSDPGVGRVLVASLHQGIADILPMRLGFYESWLDAEGLREGTIGLAPLYAVLSFLRQEDGAAYQKISARAGEYAAEWSVESMPALRRTFIKAAPSWLRGRLVLGLARQLVRSCYQGNRAVTRLRRGTGSIDVKSSVFCAVREPVGYALCGFYASAFARLLSLFDVGARVDITSCRGAGERDCLMGVTFHDRRAAESSSAP